MTIVTVLPTLGPGLSHFETGLLNQCFYNSGPVGLTIYGVTGYLPAVIVFILSTIIVRKAYSVHVARTRGESSESPALKATHYTLHKRRMETATVVLVTCAWAFVCATPYMIMLLGFPQSMLRYPMMATWVHFMFTWQFTLSPVSYKALCGLYLENMM